MIPIILFAISGIVHFIYFGKPSSVVFDEVFYGNFTSNYWQGSYFFDLHPPFVKLLFAFIGKIFNLDQYIVDWSTIGNSIPISIVSLRLLPTIAGLLLPIVIYAICRRLDFSKTSSFIAGLLVCLENSLIVQSRYLLPDIIMLLFGFSSLLFYLEHRKRTLSSKSSPFFTLSTVFAGIALSIKWTGLTFLFLIITIEIIRLFYETPSIKKITKQSLVFGLKYIFIATIIYTSLFAIHFSVLTKSGSGDPFMSLNFQKTLTGNSVGNVQTQPITFWQKFTELNKVMFTSSSGMTATHPNSSKWYTWPIMQRAIFYWQENNPIDPEIRSYIYLLGNPFIYWFGSFVIISTILYTLFKILFKNITISDPTKTQTLLFISIGYIANLLPFALIGRVMFLYHYETALVFSIIAIAFWVDALQPKNKIYASIIIITISLSAFIYWSPVTYGIPLNNKELNQRMWLPGWR